LLRNVTGEELSEKEDEVEELQARERGLKEELEKIQSQYLSDARKSIQEQREFRKVVTEWTDNDREQKNVSTLIDRIVF
jgi:guanylate kinase